MFGHVETVVLPTTFTTAMTSLININGSTMMLMMMMRAFNTTITSIILFSPFLLLSILVRVIPMTLFILIIILIVGVPTEFLLLLLLFPYISYPKQASPRRPSTEALWRS